MIAILSWIGPAAMLIAVLDVAPIFGRERRCVHDRIAGTEVRWVDARGAARALALVVAALSFAAVAVVAALIIFEVRAPDWVPGPVARLWPISAPPPSPDPGPPSDKRSRSDDVPPPSEKTEPQRPIDDVEDRALPKKVYRWVDEHGTPSYTDDLSTVPERFRTSAKPVE